jgi:hypothetical protein
MQLFERIRNQHHILRFYTHIAIFYIILQLFTNFDHKRGRNGSKKRKTFLTNLQPLTENRGTLMASLNSQASLHP